ncbi:phosphomannomutase/phosphoglucomutase [Thermomonas brevis]
MALFGKRNEDLDDAEESARKPRLDPEQAARLVAILAALGLWALVAGGLRMRDDTRHVTLEHVRDDAAAAVRRALGDQRQQLGRRLQSAEFKAAVAAGDTAAAVAALKRDWAEVQRAELWPAALEAQYAELPRSGYGTLAVAEAAIASGTTAVRVLKAGNAQRLALAAPVEGGAQPLLAYLEVPLARLTAGLESASVPAGTYLALRQGGGSVVERGDTELNTGAEAMAVKVPDSELRVAAATGDATATPFGLGGMASVGLGAALSLLAAWLWLGLRPRLLGIVRGDDAEAAPTLAELERDMPAPAAPVVVAKDAGEATADAAGPAADGEAGEQAPARPKTIVDHRIFRAYDIRGVVGRDLDAATAELIGQAIGTVMADQGLDDIVVGRDGRLSGPDMAQGLIAGLRKAGRNVIDIGMVPTPVVYFGCYHLRTGCGVAITGSHNPPDYNGFKIVVGSETLSGEAITDLHARIAGDRLYTAPSPGTLIERDIGDDYVQRIAGDIQLGTPLKVVVDAGNGVAGELGPRVLEAIGAQVSPLYCEIDGTFPNHHPDPSEPHNLQALVQMVDRLDADLGIAFDGDGDRLGVVTRSGRNIFPDRLLMLFAADVLARNPGAVIVYDVKCTGRLPIHILKHGGSPLMWKTGHSLIKSKMRETGAALAGEMSGHFFFAERWFGFDDGIYAAARLLEIVDANGMPAEQLFAELPDGVSTPEIKVEAPGGDPHEFVDRFRMMASFEGARATTIDGLRVDWPDGWGLVRASNTTPVLVMRFDADSNEAMARIQQAFREQLLALEPELPLPF